ncbi:hypothetical protein IW261DRAFT_1570751 [Armillaria novae-zelandiae]|uniref:Uncharacterized protein n=1 Tax=Armillaria novae-zelandiae TaxID=153914 RepID=A0AA39NVW8_9AGAR|nr:hypothetical protein IW261DRAFT_1570751 [Armillaria novae-zelandiae]
MDWAFEHHAFIGYNSNYYSTWAALTDPGLSWRANFLAGSITGGISTLLVDITIVCYLISQARHSGEKLTSGRYGVVGSFGIVNAGIGMKAMDIIQCLQNSSNDFSIQFMANVNWSMVYLVLMLATTVICTLLIVYRIFWHATGMKAYHKIIEMLIESSALYSISLIIYLALVSKNLESSYYMDIVTAYVRAIAPTLLVGHISAHAKANLHRQQTVAMWENHPPLVGSFREEVNNNLDDGYQTVLRSSMGNETV